MSNAERFTGDAERCRLRCATIPLLAQVRIKDLRAGNKAEGDLGLDFPTETLSVKGSIEAGFDAAGLPLKTLDR